MNTLVFNILMGILGGFLAAITFGVTTYLIHLAHNLTIYWKYRGPYLLFEKYKEKEGPKFAVKVSLRGLKLNQLYFLGEDRTDSPMEIEGSAHFGSGLPRQGWGHYQHKPGWGFIQVQISENKIYSINLFANESRDMKSVSYVWRKGTDR